MTAPDRLPLPPPFVQALRELGLLTDGATPRAAPLAGGVSSDIWRIELPGRGVVCAKRALPKLRVAADWHAPIERNVYEARWMQLAAAAVPGCAPQLLGQHAALGVLVMAYLDPAEHPLWKQRLLDGDVDVRFAAAVGDTLVRIHAAAAARPALAREFATDAIFHDIRLEPYLLATAQRHRDLAPALRALVEQTQAHPRSLVHGDVSPKNILIGPDGAAPRVDRPVAAPGAERESVGPGRPVLLDAECAWWGDPAFDLAFCLNHLLLKCLWRPPAAGALLQAFDALARTYLRGVDWEAADALEARAARLLPGLLLARVDGKSPVEYLASAAQREPVRRCARALLRAQAAPAADAASSAPQPRLADVRVAWQRELSSSMPSIVLPP